MKIGVVFTLCFWVGVSFCQNINDHVLEVFDTFQQRDLSPPDSLLLDSTRITFETDHPDIEKLNSLSNIVAHAADEQLADAFNKIVKDFCEQQIDVLTTEDALPYRKVLAIHYTNAASSIALRGRLQEVLELRYKALEILTNIQDTTGIVMTMVKLGIDHFNAQDFEQSEEWYRKSIHLMELTGDSLGIIRIQESIGSILAALV